MVTIPKLDQMYTVLINSYRVNENEFFSDKTINHFNTCDAQCARLCIDM